MDTCGQRLATLGSGRFATVECVRLSDGSLVAVKTLKSSSLQARIQCMREIAIMRAVSEAPCPYIVQLLSAGRTLDDLKHGVCFAMVVGLGGPLHKHIQRANWDFSTVRALTAELLCALCALESVGCVHRDVKASNCVLDQRGRLKLCDFGSAKMLPAPTHAHANSDRDGDRGDLEPSAGAGASWAFTLLGTAPCMAPEVVAGAGYGASADYWSLGVLLYELLTGRLPAWERGVGTGADAKAAVGEGEGGAWPDAVATAAALSMIAQLRDGAEGAEGKEGREDREYKNIGDKEDKEDKGGREGDGKGSREVREGRGSGDGRVEGALGLSLRRSWCIWEVHPALGQRQGLGLGQTQTQTGALFGFGHREDILSSQLLRALLCVRVSDRYARLGGEGQRGQSSGTQHLHTPHTSRLPLWGWAAQGHAFFEGVDWDLVDSGASPPALACFDRRLGCLELTQHDEADVLTDEQQELFAGF